MRFWNQLQPFFFFVCVLYQNVQQPEATSLKQSVKDRLGPLPSNSTEPMQDATPPSQVPALLFSGWSHVSALQRSRLFNIVHVYVCVFFQSSQSATRSSVKERLGFPKPAPADGKVVLLFFFLPFTHTGACGSVSVSETD